jgi:diacylglycerol O-acyltransferase / wax synthase
VHDRLSALDASFLHLERLETPMHTGALAIFEGAPLLDARGRFRLADVRALVASRLHLIPRFRKRVMPVPLEAASPVWVDDDRFDVAAHVRLARVPAPGTRAQLLDAFERIQIRLLDRRRPLWELWFLDGLEGGEVGLAMKAHHALVDGVSGVDVALTILDLTPDPVPVDAPAWRPRPAPSPARLLIDSVRERVREPVRPVGRAGALRSLGGVAAAATAVDVEARTSLNDPVGSARRFGLVRVPLDDLQLVRRAFGGTVNDVVLAGLGGGLARLLAARGELRPDLALKVFCPVSLREEDERMRLGNRLSAMFVPLPIGEPDAVARLHAVRDATADLKIRDQPLGTATLLGLGELVPPAAVGLAARALHHQPFFHLVCTNIPGPQAPLYCLGARMLEAYPLVPLSMNMNLNVAVLSYAGQVHFGLLADRDRWPDLGVLEAGIEDAFAELTKLAAEPPGPAGS